MKRYPGLKPLVVRFNHGFLRPNLRANCDRVFRKLGVDVHDLTPSRKVVQRLMLQSFHEKGDFCWHCHTGIYAYPMQLALKEQVPLIFWVSLRLNTRLITAMINRKMLTKSASTVS